MNIDIGMFQGFEVEPMDYSYNRNGDGAVKVDEYIDKKYIYRFSIDADETDVTLLRQYLMENMIDESSIELWHLWAGSSGEEFYKTKTSVKNVAPNELDGIEEEIDRYKDSVPVMPKRRKVTIQELKKDDISFFIENVNVCLAITK